MCLLPHPCMPRYQPEHACSPAECFAAATGFDDYPKWAGGMKKVNILKRKGGIGTEVQWTMGILNLVDRPVFVYKYNGKSTEMQWTVREPSACIKGLQGRYNFESVDGGRKTKVLYKLNVEPRVPFPSVSVRVCFLCDGGCDFMSGPALGHLRLL